MTVAAVVARYDELHALVSDVATASAPDPAAGVEGAALVATEARLLDQRRFDEWLARWADDGLLWVPLNEDAHPARDQSLFLDDRRRIAERVEWRAHPSAWSQHPASTTVRVVGTVEAWPRQDELVVRSAFTLSDHRAGRPTETIAGHQIHRFGPRPGRLLRAKVILLPALAGGTDDLSFLL